jgi:hypothetical protein
MNTGSSAQEEEEAKMDRAESKYRDTLALPREITRLHEGKYIIYSEDEKRVIGVGDTPEEASKQAKASGVNGEWHYAYAFRSDEEIF